MDATMFMNLGKKFPYRIVKTRRHEAMSLSHPAKIRDWYRDEETAAFRYQDEAEAYVKWLNTREEDK